VAEVIPFLPFPDEEELSPAPSGPIHPLDAEARARALDIHHSFIVEAPAGSGKTGLLIQRYLKLLADDSVTSPEQVLAITFTLKATAELRDRVLAHLEAAHLESATNNTSTSHFNQQTRILARAVITRDRQLDWHLLTHPHRLNIRTIDSVCAEIARTLPVLSGSGGRLSPATDATPLYREAARRTLLLLGSGDPVFDEALRNLLLHRDGNLADCETLLADMLALRDQWGALFPLTSPHLDDASLDANVLPRLQAALEQAICTELTKLAGVIDEATLTDLTELAAQMAHSDGYKGQPSPIALCRGRNQSPGSRAEDLDHWQSLIHLLIKPSKPRDWRKGVSRNIVGFEIEKHHEAQLKHIIARLSASPSLIEILCRIDSLPPAEYPPNQWAVAKSLFRVLSRALIELQLVFATRGQCDFTELSLLARTALTAESGPEDLAAALGARLQHLLVDEMQDTSAAQYDLIDLLTASWDGHSQTVFLVGDPRQSIYLFRQARVERFLQTMRTQRLGDLPLTRLRLTANFRSQQTLVHQFNQDFTSIFPPGAPETLPYTNAEAILPPSGYATALNWHATPVEIRPGDTDRTPAQLRQRQARRDAREIRRIARRWLAKPLPPTRTKSWQIAVLVRSRSHLAEIVANFDNETHGRIPYRAVEITPLNERQEILDLTALTRALLHPADRTAALAVLHAPWCGLSLADLHTLTGADDPTLKDRSIQRLLAERGHLLPEESIQRLQRVWQVLEVAATQRARLTTAQLVERAWRSLGGDAWLKPEELVNAGRFFQLIDEMELSAVRIDPTLLDARLQRLYAEPNFIPPGQPFVELLTMHKAKGLEWDVVLVPALERSPGINRTRLLTWSELDSTGDEAAPIMLAPIAAKGEEVDPLTRWLKAIYREREAAERKRLFYVASTRAREELHLFAAPDLLANGNINPRWDSLLKSAWPAAQSHFIGARTATTSGDPGLASETWVRATNLSNIESFPISGPEPLVLDLAAAATPSHPILHRLPLTFDPTTRFITARTQTLPYGDQAALTPNESAHFTRPEGSFAARSFGNVVHTFLELIAARIAAGATPATLLAGLPAWLPRIAAILRADGLPSATVDRLTRETRAALENLFRDPDGLWLLTSHPNAASELAFTAQETTGDTLASIRIDRIFHAGPEPHIAGDQILWIIDYKTAAHGPSGLDDFLAAQRATYAPQLETYARILAAAQSKPLSQVRLALYYPTIPRLIWWQSENI
jgi:ATP-dependent helicase/nuclease subunit A